MPLIVLDRDGVINEDSADYIRSLADWRPVPGSIAAIAALSRAGYTVAIATNQSGLGRGYFSLDDLAAIHARLCQLVAEQGGRIAGIFYCPHLPGEGCLCRKPATGLLAAMEAELGLSARGAIFIGDSLGDLQAARAYGCRPVLVRTGKGEATLRALQSGEATLADWAAIPVHDNLAAASREILRQQSAPKDDR
ncbi:MAG: D-glycero-beta-D-manno-heptose 1,7-bisphosphate 7-phosphatase [Pseudomonadales bacterium]|nr:D-glycero-beta-D-manno-heptose 1,7-bisphosphate 7-phosphatase [Halioglobus sp.]MCP5121225.1 D-glycero-beta-D-manno-heptose 1,7-bisphosphate 7-phosphatase [Pseudomonadales bacterium]MCP5193435.1 D-glycero-beta-D-manno-heptose 1,7-bisphosphate 7-phosphatase [Pseudomonadales bacterium]